MEKHEHIKEIAVTVFVFLKNKIKKLSTVPP